MSSGRIAIVCRRLSCSHLRGVKWTSPRKGPPSSRKAALVQGRRRTLTTTARQWECKREAKANLRQSSLCQKEIIRPRLTGVERSCCFVRRPFRSDLPPFTSRGVEAMVAWTKRFASCLELSDSQINPSASCPVLRKTWHGRSSGTCKLSKQRCNATPRFVRRRSVGEPAGRA